MSFNVVLFAVCAGGAQSTDVMQSFKTGHLLGASPRAQFVASVAGCVTGVWGSVAGWYLFKGLIPACAPPVCQVMSALLLSIFIPFPS